MSRGRKNSLVYSLGLSSGLVFWGLIAATGMGAVLQGSLYLLMILKVVGGIYLLWLAVKSAQTAIKEQDSAALAVDTGPVEKRWFWRGLLLNMSNPKSVIAWMAALSIGLRPGADTSAVIAATVVCIAVGFATNALYSFVFSIKGMMHAYRRFSRAINTIVALLFAAAGFAMIRSAFTE